MATELPGAVILKTLAFNCKELETLKLMQIFKALEDAKSKVIFYNWHKIQGDYFSDEFFEDISSLEQLGYIKGPLQNCIKITKKGEDNAETTKLIKEIEKLPILINIVYKQIKPTYNQKKIVGMIDKEYKKLY